MGPPLHPDATRPHVVVIDDEEDLCELLILRLEHHGFRASAEHTIRGGLEIVERETVDAMIVDLRLESENGLDLLTEVLKRSADLPVIILTAHGTIETAVEAMNRGAYGFLTKPFDDSELVQKLRQAVERGRLGRELAGLQRVVGAPATVSRLLGTSEAMVRTREILTRAAATDASVLILGESGTGKEVAARSIHEMSPRRRSAFVAVNCAALPADLLESELFGYVKGAFTGAHRNKDGLFAAAEGGTLFLDEIGDAPPSVQVKLLRVLQERTYMPVGATVPRSADVRIVAATNRDLRAQVTLGQFREDLFYRLHVVPVSMPPLRDRPEDIPILAEIFLSRATASQGERSPRLSREALRLLMRHSWPGNVRELANVVEGAAVLSADGRLSAEHVLAVLAEPPAPEVPAETKSEGAERSPSTSAETKAEPTPTRSPLSLIAGDDGELMLLREAREAFDRYYLEEALARSGGNVSAAAKRAGRNRTDFHELLRRHDINAAEFREEAMRSAGQAELKPSIER